MNQPPSGARRPLLLASLCCAALMASCSGEAPKTTRQQEQGLKKRDPTRVRVVPVEAREMRRVLSTTTTVESEKEVRVFPRTSGVVMKVLVEEGDAVAEGDVLAELDARDRDAMLEEARVAVREAEDSIKKSAIAVREAAARVDGSKLAWDQAVRDYERNEKANLISQAALDGLRLARDTKLSDFETSKLAFERSQAEGKSADTALEKARISVRSRELELSFTRITAPFAGVVAQRMIKVGDAVGAAAHAFVLTDALNLRALVYRPQKELDLFTRARAGNGSGASLEIRAVAEALPGLSFRGAIQRVSPSIDASSGSFRITVGLEPAAVEAAERKLLPGMLVRVEIVTDRHPNALAVPKRALRREGENDILFVARDGKARRVVVVEGYAEDALVEVTPTEGALAEGDLVIIVGNRELEDGGDVEFEAAKEPGATPAKAPGNESATATEVPKQG